MNVATTIQKFQTYDATTRVVIHFLELLNVKVTKTSVKNLLQNHPDYPSLLSISDALKKWNLENGSIQIEKEDLLEMSTPFISYLKGGGGRFIVVKNISETQVTYFNGLSDSNESVNSFVSRWNGIILLAEPTEESGEIDYLPHRRKEFRNAIILPTFFAAGIFSIFLSFFFYPNQFPFRFVVFYTCLLLTNWIGIGITSTLLWYEIDKKNSFIQKICTGVAKTNCTAILSSKHAKPFGIISWSEIGFFYFVFSFLCLFFKPELTPIITFLSVMASPYILFSVYYQWRVARQWCILCLSVQFILLTNLCISFLIADHSPLKGFLLELQKNIINLPFLFVITFFPIGFWFFIKPKLKRNVMQKDANIELNRFKYNEDFFLTQLQKQDEIIQPPGGLGITLGNPHASHTLIKVCNPYCGPCAKAHSEIENLLQRCSDLKIQIIFAVTNHESDIKALPAKHLLAIHEKGDKSHIERALNDWYSAENKDYDQFATKHPLNIKLSTQDQKIEEMEKWCTQVNIEYTPTFFYDGHHFPRSYSVKDLYYFISLSNPN